MGIVFNFGDEPEEEQPGKRITFGKLDFIADQFGDLCLREPEPTEKGEQSLRICAFAARLEEDVDAGPDPLRRYLRRYAHLFVEDGREGEPVPTFHTSKTTDLDSASNPTSTPHCSTSQPLGRSGRTTTTHGETLSQAVVEHIEPLAEEHQPPDPTGRDDIDDAPDQQGWWDDTDVSGLIDPEAFCRFLYSCDQLLENSDSDRDDNEVTPPTADSGTGPSSDEQPKLAQPPPMEG
jgi:hypothetical protein